MKIIIYIAFLLSAISLYAQGPVDNDAIVFQSGFEEGNKDIWDDWDGNPDETNLLVEDPGPYNTPGNHVMKLIPPPGERGGGDLVKVLPSKHDSLYVRWYIKYEKGFNFNARNHGGGLVAGDRSMIGVSDYRPDGTNRVSVGLEYNTKLHTPQIYTYYRGMYQDCANPNGSCWGDVFPCTSDDGKTYCKQEQHREPPLPPTLEDDRWYCMEMKLNLGTPSEDGSIRNGEISLWVDGENYGKWDDLWMRTTDELKIENLYLALFHHDGTHSGAGVLYDDVVVSTKPIGMGKATKGYSDTNHRELEAGEIPVSAPGYYGEAGKTYVLVNDIVSPRTAMFLGNNVTLDLNGYEIVYADGGYEQLPNYDFEEGLVGWDFSKAPSAKIEGKKVQVFVGENVLRLKAGEEITSGYINLPEADRSYFAMCGVAKNTMYVSVYIEDENGDVVYSTNEYGSGQRQGSPVENKRPQLGGGFVFAHMKGKPAGKYRVRVKANTDAIVDHIDLRPSLDVGVGIVEKTYTNTHNDQMYEGWYDPAFYDYTKISSSGTPLDGIPVVPPRAEGTITIKNGVIRSGATGILSWGIQSTATNVKMYLDNVKIVTEGINTNAVEVRQANITNCLFDVNTPFIINRHNSGRYAVDIVGTDPSEVSYSEFYGGQGCLTIKGLGSKIHHNYFQNRQTVTNHYALAPASESEIYNNVFKAETGSGIGIGSRHLKIYNNEIHIESAPPTCEYGHEDYSVNGIRLADYNAPVGDPTGCFGNEVFNNTFYITGKDYPEYVDYIPVATAIFYSASAGDNYIYDNEVVVNALNPDSKALTSAFYIGGGTIGGVFENNTVTTNVPAFWLASPYGKATKTKVLGNTIIKSPDAKEDYAPIRLGYGGALATDIEFVSNKIVGGSGKLEFSGTPREHTYSVGWELKVKVVDEDGRPLTNEPVVISNKKNEVVAEEATSETGSLSAILSEYMYYGRLEHSQNPYKISVGDKEVEVTLEKDTEIEVKLSTITGIKQGDATGLIYGPNPVDTNLEILFHNSRERTVSILDMSTKLYFESTIHSKQTMIDTSLLAAGIYLLRITEDKSVVTKKLVKL